jgi:hypothetical protein
MILGKIKEERKEKNDGFQVIGKGGIAPEEHARICGKRDPSSHGGHGRNRRVSC